MVLVDSNVLLRVLQRDHPMHEQAWKAVRTLHQKKELVLAPQNIVEPSTRLNRDRAGRFDQLGFTQNNSALSIST